MNTSMTLRLGLDDLLGELRHARRSGELGRLALIAYCDVRRWARQAREWGVAELAASMFTAVPHASRDAFLEQVDTLVFELEQAKTRMGPIDAPPQMPPASSLGVGALHGTATRPCRDHGAAAAAATEVRLS